jgi:hypothetical protein
MAKANAGGGRDYGSSDAYEPQAPEDGPKDPAADLQQMQVKLAQMKAAEKRLQDDIVRLTAHAVASKALDAQLTPEAIDAVTTSRAELTTFVASGMKALDTATAKTIRDERTKSDKAIEAADGAVTLAVADSKAKQAAAAESQKALSTAAKDYAMTTDVTARVKKATADLVALRQKVEALVRENRFGAAGFWLFELEQQLSAAPTLDKAQEAFATAWRKLEAASTDAGVKDDELTAATAKEAASKKALDDATKNRVAKTLENIELAARPKTASAA